MTKELEHWVPELCSCFPCVTAGMAIACRMCRMKSAPAVLLSATGGHLCSFLALPAASTAAPLSITPCSPGDLAPWSRATLIHRPAFQLLPLSSSSSQGTASNQPLSSGTREVTLPSKTPREHRGGVHVSSSEA